MRNLIFFGAPGAGKGTQAKKIAEKFNLKHLSTGDVLRKEITAKTELGIIAQTFMDKGELVPDDVIIGMVEKIIADNLHCEGFIFDGFPRTYPQAEALDIMLKKYNIEISYVIFLDVPQQELIHRLAKRAEIEGRDDDKNVEIIENRINVYKQKTAPVLEYYEKQNKLYKVDGVGEIDVIFDKIISIL
jgi:adenylate kinase